MKIQFCVQVIGILAIIEALSIPKLSAQEINFFDIKRQPNLSIERVIEGVIIAQVPEAGRLVEITAVRLNSSQDGLEILLETSASGLQPLIIPEGNTLVIEIPDAVLLLPEGAEFIATDPGNDIAEVKIVQVDPRTVRISIVGKDGVPNARVLPSEKDLVLGITSSQTSKAEEEIEVVARQERQEQGYITPEASIGTGIDTPILDIPQSIQVVPQQLIRDRGVTELEQALETVPGISFAGGRGTSIFGPNILIRGFISNQSIFRDGIPYFSLVPITTVDIDRIEVLKGPASVLFGQGEPGGAINLVSKKPLDEPYLSVSFTAGNFNRYQGTIDISGPLNSEKTLKYRLNLSYENFDSFRDFVSGEEWMISPVLTWDITPDTSFTIYAQYVSTRETIDEGIPAFGNGVVDIPRSRFLGERFGVFEQDQFLVGYTFNHDFTDNLSVRHALQYVNYQPLRFAPLFDFFEEETGILNRIEYAANGNYERFFTNAELLGQFNTGPVEHQLLFGVEYRYGAEDPAFQFSNSYPPINVFNPVYSRTPYDISPEFFRDDYVNRVAVYLQDQINLLPNLILLAGVRYDHAYQFRTTRNLGEPREEFSQTDTAFSPRVGIVYQPIPIVSLYGSYSTSFNPSFGTSRNFDGSTFEPETGQQFEVGVKADITNQLSVTFAAFDIKKQNVQTPDPNDPLFTIQTGEQTSQGIELYVGGEILPGWNVVMGYAYLNAYVSKDNTELEGNRLANVPYNQFSLWTTYEIQRGSLEGLGFGLGLFSVGSRPGDIDNTFVLPSYLRTDVALYYQRDNWQVQLNIENLFDVLYFPSASFGSRLGVNPGSPFAISGRISIQF